MFRQIRWRIAFYYVALILLSMAGLCWYLAGMVRDSYLADLRKRMTYEARVVDRAVGAALLLDSQAKSVDELVRGYAGLLQARVTLVATDGVVLGDSEEPIAQMDNHLDRPEIQQALSAGQGSSLRFSRTTGQSMMYTAVSHTDGERLLYVTRVAVPLTYIDANVARLRRTVVAATVVAALLAVLLALLVAEYTARPVRRLTELSKRLADGDLSGRIVPSTQDEVGALARAFNRMADRLRESFTSQADEHGRLVAVLEHMSDGVMLTDDAGDVTLLNPAAARLTGTSEEVALGRSFPQAARDHRLIQAWKDCRATGEERVAMVDSAQRGPLLRAIVTPLANAKASTCLVMLQDLTQVRRLETVRRDFISNISHELRTPLASLQALVDTLRDGALQDPPAAERFLNRMDAEVDAMTQMVQELLELARIESGQAPLRRVMASVADALRPAAERLRPQAERAGLELQLDLPADLPQVMLDPERIQQVLINVLHNAIKFTPAGGRVVVAARSSAAAVVVSVEDNGSGIAPEDLPRVFERFYKSDRARSTGGTGLGLSISKHIVEGHGGRIWAESPYPPNTAGPRPGTRVSFSLPLDVDSGKQSADASSQR